MAAQTQYKKHVKTTITKDEPHCHSSRKKIFNTNINLLACDWLLTIYPAYRCSNELNRLSFRSIWDGYDSLECRSSDFSGTWIMMNDILDWARYFSEQFMVGLFS